MIIDFNDEAHIDGLAKVFDATGQEYKHVEWCNTETGEIRMLAEDSNGAIRLTPDKMEIIREQIIAPAPLRVEWDDSFCSVD